jgi:hypothetical protein
MSCDATTSSSDYGSDLAYDYIAAEKPKTLIDTTSGMSINDIIDELKSLGQIWGVQGSFLAGPIHASFGYHDESFSEQILEAQKEFVYELPEDHPFYPLTSSIGKIHASVDYSPSEAAAAIIKGETVLVRAGTNSHFVFLVFASLKINGETHHVVYKCNRGEEAGLTPGVEVYRIKELSRLKETLEFIAEDRQDESGMDTFNNEINRLLDLEPLDYLIMKPQMKDNCVKASTNAAFYALLFHTALPQCEDDSLKAQELAYATYKQFTKNLRLTSLNRFLTFPWTNHYLLGAISQKIMSSHHYPSAEKVSLVGQITTKMFSHAIGTEFLEFAEDDSDF